MLYLIGNGIGPDMAEEWVKAMGKNYFDYQANRQLEWLSDNAHTFEGKYHYWDEYLRKKMPFEYYGERAEKRKKRRRFKRWGY